MPEVRSAQLQDREILDALLQIAKTEISSQRGGKIYLETEIRSDFSNLAEEIKNPNTHILVGIYEDVIVGWGFAEIYTTDDDSKIARVRELFVQSEARGIGVGEELLSKLLDWATENKCSGIEGTALPGNREAKGIFERFGIKARMLTLYKDI